MDLATDLVQVRVTRRGLLTGAAGVAGALLLPPQPARAAGAIVSVHGPQAAARWVRASYAVVAAQGVTPPTAARAYAGTWIAVYEALLGGMPHHRSLAGQVHALSGLPRPAAPGQVHWPLVVGAAASTVLTGLFAELRPAARSALDDALAAGTDEAARAGASAQRQADSLAHGRAVARAVLAWLATDGHAEASAAPYSPPTGEALWVPTPPNFGTAIEPHCEQVRPLVLLRTDEVAPAPPVPFSTAPGSPFWLQARATYDQSFANTDDQRDLARFWTDNPVFSGLPAGHWLSIAVQVAEQRGLALDVTAEALVRTAVALHDAFLNCWTWKYRYDLLRPVTYVRRHLDPAWSTWVNTPQFPEHTSGHSVASRAAAVVLTDLLGSAPFDDTSLATTAGLVRRTRRWGDFADAADTAARSRLYGGIHYPHGIDAGAAQGDQVGALVLARLVTRR